jgi:hypothetical protein
MANKLLQVFCILFFCYGVNHVYEKVFYNGQLALVILFIICWRFWQ